jgi:hypothetical protein
MQVVPGVCARQVRQELYLIGTFINHQIYLSGNVSLSFSATKLLRRDLLFLKIIYEKQLIKRHPRKLSKVLWLVDVCVLLASIWFE